MKLSLGLVLPALYVALSFSGQTASAQQAAPDAQTQILLDKIGTWDGVTPSAKLDGAYETGAALPQFGLIGYWNQPWRAYMDTWPATRLLRGMAINWTVLPKYAEPMAQILEESGIRQARLEISWSGFGWDDKLAEGTANSLKVTLAAMKKHRIRPMIVINANHGSPVPTRGVAVEVLAEAKKGDRVLKLKPGTKLKVGYVGLRHPAYIAAYPMVTKVDDDGTAHLSSGLGQDVKIGRLDLIELKYQPFQPLKLKDGTPIPAAQETLDGFQKYLDYLGDFARDGLGTRGAADSGFDIEVWNEMTFGSNFLDINNYYDEKFVFGDPLVVRKARPWAPGFRPDAKTQFEKSGAYALLATVVDHFSPANGFNHVLVDDGFGNQAPWSNSSDSWPGQGALSRHYYTGPQGVLSPSTPDRAVPPRQGGLDALGNFNGVKEGDWWQVKPGTAFVPTFVMNYPEFFQSGFKTETAARDLVPDSRLSNMGQPGRDRHGRYTHNGDFHPLQVWQTEVEYDRTAFTNAIMEQAGVKADDPRLLALATHMAGKMLFRQYLFHLHKGFDRIYLFSLDSNILNYGPMPHAIYDALDKSDYKFTPAVRAALPQHFKSLMWLTKQLESSDEIAAPRPLRVDELNEIKPRLVFAGDGTAAHPSRYNRDQFAFLPFQQTANKFLVPYYVVTLNVEQSWDKAKDVLDPARYDMPDQQFDVTIGNIAGIGARVSAYDPLSNSTVPVKVLEATPNSLKVRLQTADYPRLLQIEEAKPGVQILEPQVAAEKGGGVRVSWKTNMPVGAARVTYGPDWTSRGASDVILETGNRKEFSAVLPGASDLVAARIRVAGGGLSDVWPRWDEDPQGQIGLRPGTDAATPRVGPVTAKASEDFSNSLGQYEAAALPQDSKPAWTASSILQAGAVRLEAGALVLDTSADLAQKAYFSLGGFGMDDARGYTVEARLEIADYKGGGTGTDAGFTLQVFGNRQLMQVDLSDRQIAIRGGLTKDFNLADRLHTLRLLKHGGDNLFDVYVDGVLLQRDVPSANAGADRINWGDASPVRGMKARVAYIRVDSGGAYLPGAKPLTVALMAPAGIALPVQETNAAHGYTLLLPAGARCSGEADDRSCAFGGVTLRVRYLAAAAGNLDAYLPASSVTDVVDRKRVTLPGGAFGILARYDLMAAAHPGMVNLAQRYMALQRDHDLLLFSVTGTPAAVQANDKTLQAIFAGVK